MDRDSGTFGVETFDYGNVEIAADVGWENYKRVADGMVRLYEQTGLFHGYSFNSWSDVVTYDREFLGLVRVSSDEPLLFAASLTGHAA